MGADLRVVNHRSAGAEPVADIEVRPRRCRAFASPSISCRSRSTSFRRLFVAAACAEGETVVTGAEELRVKESDRIAVMAEGLTALGVACEVLPDGIRIQGRPERQVFAGGTVDSHGDHRVAMSFAIASARARAPIRILDVENVATSFPDFPGVARAAGLNVVAGQESTSAFASHHHRRAERLRQGHDLAPGGATGSAGTCWTAAPCTGWWPMPGSARAAPVRRGRARRRRPAPGRAFRHRPHGGEQIWLAGEDVSQRIRTEQAGEGASRVAAMPAVRSALLDRQRAFAGPPGLVADGRDMGTVVFPGAGLKIFLTASAEERARRRYNQLKEKGLGASLAALSRR